MSDATRNGKAGGKTPPQNGHTDPFQTFLCSPEGTSRLHVLDWLAAVQLRELKLCALLEVIADALPVPPDRNTVSPLIPGLRVIVPRHEVIVRQILLPRLREASTIPSDEIESMAQRFSRDNAMDMLLADDAADLLEASLGSHASAQNAGMLGFVLRGFFEGRRRHIEWEKAVLIPLAQTRLQPERLMPLSEAEVQLILSSGQNREENRNCQ